MDEESIRRCLRMNLFGYELKTDEEESKRRMDIAEKCREWILEHLKDPVCEHGTDAGPIPEMAMFGSFYWQTLRKCILIRDDHTCRRCGYRADDWMEVHHILPRRMGGKDHPANLITLCRKCHDDVHRHGVTEKIVDVSQKSLDSYPVDDTA